MKFEILNEDDSLEIHGITPAAFTQSKKARYIEMQREELISKWSEEIQNTNLEGLELLTKVFGGISQNERYNINTTPERIKELKAIKAQQEAEEKEKERQDLMNSPSPYSLNPTMRLLGRQCALGYIERYESMYDEVMQAHPHEGTYNICIDMFSLGIICGKRMDRQRRKERAAAGER